MLALILNFAGALLKEKKRSGRHQEMYIAPEEMVGDRRSGMQRTVKTQATEYVPQRRNENRIKKVGGWINKGAECRDGVPFQVRSVACRECMKKRSIQ